MVLHRLIAWRRAGIILRSPHTLSDVNMVNLLCTGKLLGFFIPSEDTLADLVRICAFISCDVVGRDDKEVRCVC